MVYISKLGHYVHWEGRKTGHVIFVGFGTLCLMTVIGLVVIGIAAPDLFHVIVQRLKELSDAVLPSIVRSLV